MKIEIVVGTRPEIIKMAPVIRKCLKSNEIELRVVHTGQHYDQKNMSPQFFTDLPLGYLDFLKLLANARVVITDSGGIQEEASILQVPCITVRDNTERPETTSAGVNLLVKVNKDTIKEIINNIIDDDVLWHSMRGKSNLYGDDKAAERIVQILLPKGGCN